MDFPAKQDIFLKIKELCHIRNLNRCRLILLDISSSSLDMRENLKWPVSTVAIVNFPAKQDIFLKIKELYHLVHKTLEQMPFTFLRYLN